MAHTNKRKMWCNVGSLAVGVVLEIDRVVVEDAAWLCKPFGVGHINVAELDAVLKGGKFGSKWNLKTISIMTDSPTILSWLLFVLETDFRVKVTGV